MRPAALPVLATAAFFLARLGTGRPCEHAVQTRVPPDDRGRVTACSCRRSTPSAVAMLIIGGRRGAWTGVDIPRARILLAGSRSSRCSAERQGAGPMSRSQRPSQPLIRSADPSSERATGSRRRFAGRRAAKPSRSSPSYSPARHRRGRRRAAARAWTTRGRPQVHVTSGLAWTLSHHAARRRPAVHRQRDEVGASSK